MVDVNAWNQWSKFFSESEQIKRQKRACENSLTPSKLEKESGVAIFKGSHGNEYITTLSTCTCRDFALKKQPCKHMYRLAYELHLFEFSNTEGPSNTHLLTKDEVMEIITKVLTPDEQKAFGYFCYHCGNNNASEDLFAPDLAQRLLDAKLACEVTVPSKLLKHLHISNVRKFLPPGAKSPRTKAALIELVSPLVTKEDIIFPDEKKCLTLHPSIAHLGHTIHRQICKLYPEPDSF